MGRKRGGLTGSSALDYILFGVMLLQLITYISHAKRDKPFNQVIVVRTLGPGHDR